MNASPQPFHRPPQDQEVLGELLHSLSQPLTSLRCSLELSIEEVAGQQQEAVSVALEQAERVIGLVKLMREYLDAELALPPPQSVALAPVLRAVVEQLSSVAAVRQVRLQLVGTCAATIPVAETRLRLALQYLIGVLIETQQPNREITLRLKENSSESVLWAQVAGDASTDPQSRRGPVSGTLRKVKLAIASRMLESAGASLVFDDRDRSGFVLRIPRSPDASRPAELLI
ncbi:MAG: HAMP domain-containing histidine kinase [Candidatus Koribacter versatilis]|nr:HAMP domain-containing histidine kinase [Candidatus Koribacter versatilis]